MTQPTEGNDALSRALQRLPTDIEPPHDLWPGVAAAIARERRPQRASVWAMRIAAGLVCVAIGTGLGYGLFRGPATGPGVGPSQEAINTWLVKPVMMDAGYQKARMQLASEFFRRIADLPANDRARVQKGLKQIEDGLRELNDALKSHPDSVLLQQLVLGAYQQELEYMQNVASLTQTVSEQTQT
ncbi:MAG TPA: hypothetical protein VE046_11060 [Steroidobacteraceae bacterium]|nr:hypothetical protein [Steroidobacteraceae bacterium]